MKVIGTAGHIDHGKSALVYRLTGTDPDRLEEEQRRGMTIDLGFAVLHLPSGERASVVDVPGHERFVRTMLAGAAGIDVALLVVAADEGFMPQTREHLDILDLLGVRHAVVALTKTDVVDAEWLELAREDVRDNLAGTALRASPIVPLSSVSGEGLDELRDALDAALAAAPTPRDRGRPYLPVDRVFTMQGFGTVITGTLHDGTIDKDMEAVLMPANQSVRIRGMQVHGEAVLSAAPGARVAVNLQGVHPSQIARGDVVALRGAVRSSTRVDVYLRVLQSSPNSLRHGMTVQAHVGAAESSASLTLLEADELAAGESGCAQLRFERPLAVTRDQMVVLRLPAPGRTVAGGSIVDVAPRHRRSSRSARTRLTGLVSAVPEVRVAAALASAGPLSDTEVAFRAGLSTNVTQSVLAKFVASEEVQMVGSLYISGERWDALVELIRDTLSAYHSVHPLQRGMSKQELREKVGWKAENWPDVVALLQRNRVILAAGALIALVGHSSGIESRRTHVDSVMNLLIDGGFSPLPVDELLKQSGADEPLLRAMVDEGKIVRVQAALYLERSVYEGLVRHVLDSIRSDGTVTVAGLRDSLGTSRKHALAFLEYLDGERITRRVGDSRVLGTKGTSCA